jgi:hypothetical protein
METPRVRDLPEAAYEDSNKADRFINSTRKENCRRKYRGEKEKHLRLIWVEVGTTLNHGTDPSSDWILLPFSSDNSSLQTILS